MLSKESTREIFLVLLAIGIGIIFQPIQKLANNLFSMSWGLTMNEWLGIMVMAFAIWIILRYLRSIDDKIQKERAEAIIKGIGPAFENAIDKQTTKIINALKLSIGDRLENTHKDRQGDS